MRRTASLLLFSAEDSCPCAGGFYCCSLFSGWSGGFSLLLSNTSYSCVWRSPAPAVFNDKQGVHLFISQGYAFQSKTWFSKEKTNQKCLVLGTLWNFLIYVSKSKKIGRVRNCISYLAFLFKVYWCLRVGGAGDMTGLLQSLVEACDVLFHFFQWR